MAKGSIAPERPYEMYTIWLPHRIVRGLCPHCGSSGVVMTVLAAEDSSDEGDMVFDQQLYRFCPRCGKRMEPAENKEE